MTRVQFPIFAFVGLCMGVSAYALAQPGPTSWKGELRDAAGKPLAGARVELRVVAEAPSMVGRRGGSDPAEQKFETTTDPGGAFAFRELPSGSYSVAVSWRGRTATLGSRLVLQTGERQKAWVEVSSDGQHLTLSLAGDGSEAIARVGERLSSKEVSGLPLNKRDFGQLLLLAAGTRTDTNGAANFTQQFAVNGQRGTSAVFAMDGVDTTDPELGGATFANFNVDAIQEIHSRSGVMPATFGRGAAGFTNVVTKSGTEGIHGAVFEFVRNAAFDARNFFDRRTLQSPGRLPPFARNEFGFTNGGPVALPGHDDGRKRTFYFGQYQGFRQVLGTTQVFAVPTKAERQGMDTSAFPGDTLVVSRVDPRIVPVLTGYPSPNDPQGPYGARTFSISSKVSTTSDQFSVRIDHRISDKANLFARFNFNNVTGPTTNPAQTAIDPSFATLFFDHQRNFGLTYTRAVSSSFTSETSFGFLRSTPIFSSPNHTQPGVYFGDALYTPFNASAGSISGSFGNIFQVRQNIILVRGAHTVKLGVETRFNRDTTIGGSSPNGAYQFGGGTAYAQVAISSVSGQHDIGIGDPLPDALTGLLTATPYAFTASVASPLFAQGDRIGESAVRREAYNFYAQDTWKVRPRLTLNYGLRYEVNSRFHEAHRNTSTPVIVGPGGQPARYWDPGASQKFLVNPQPPYRMDWRGLGPRLSLEWRVTNHTILRAGGGITTILPNLFQENTLMGVFPSVVNTFFTATSGSPVLFQNVATPFKPPSVLFFTPQGQPVYPTGNTSDVPPNTEIDIQRFNQILAAVTPGNQVQPLLLFGMSSDYQNGYIETYTAGVEHNFGDVRFVATYVGTAGVKLAAFIFPNSYGGAGPGFAPFTRFDSSGRVVGGLGPEYFISNRSHSTFHSLQASALKTSLRAGLGFQVGYTFSKSLDDTSSVFGGFGSSSSGALLQTFPQNPANPGAEKGPSVFDIAHVLAFSLIQTLPIDRWAPFRLLGRRVTSGWQLLNIGVLASGSPFSVYSGVHQTGTGGGGADRPDQIGRPVLSTSRAVREDYFGQGTANPSFFSIPIGVPGGTGPNRGRFGTLGRNTFRGPTYHNLDLALIKDTPFGRRGAGEAVTLQFRAEFFNVLNAVNFSLPANIVRGTGFGLISRTAGSARQLQFSLKLIY